MGRRPKQPVNQEASVQPAPDNWGDGIANWINDLSDDANVISLYVYSKEKAANGVLMSRQEAFFQFNKNEPPPELHDIGALVGSGSFNIVARANGKTLFQRMTHFGELYTALKAERMAGKASVPAPSPTVAPSFNGEALLGNITKWIAVISPLIPVVQGLFKGYGSSSERLQEMSDKLVEKSLEFNLRSAEQAGKQIIENARLQAVSMTANEPATEDDDSGWKNKIVQLGELLINHGESFLASSDKSAMKTTILNDSSFQALTSTPKRIAQTLTKIYKMVEAEKPGQGVALTNKIMMELGIKIPKLVNGSKK